MTVLSSCCNRFAALSKAAAKSASAKLRSMGMRTVHQDWASRASLCERCPMRVIEHNVTYCGKPFLKLVVRDDAVHGCGCPVNAKAKDPGEHCPITIRHAPATRTDSHCDCRWCSSPAR